MASATWVALLRGINVGGKNPLPMRDLIKLLEGLGHSRVRTYIQSGNVTFQCASGGAAAIASGIVHAIRTQYGFEVAVLVMPASALAAIVSANPFPEAEADPKTLHVFFLAAEPRDADWEQLTQLKAADERFELANGALYLHAPNGFGRSKLAAATERYLGVQATARNWRTTLKLMELCGATA